MISQKALHLNGNQKRILCIQKLELFKADYCHYSKELKESSFNNHKINLTFKN